FFDWCFHKLAVCGLPALRGELRAPFRLRFWPNQGNLSKPLQLLPIAAVQQFVFRPLRFQSLHLLDECSHLPSSGCATDDSKGIATILTGDQKPESPQSVRGRKTGGSKEKLRVDMPAQKGKAGAKSSSARGMVSLRGFSLRLGYLARLRYRAMLLDP